MICGNKVIMGLLRVFFVRAVLILRRSTLGFSVREDIVVRHEIRSFFEKLLKMLWSF